MEQIPKNLSQFGLESATDSMKSESLVIVDQNATVNTFPGLVHTARQAMEEGSALSRDANPQGKLAPKARLLTGAKS